MLPFPPPGCTIMPLGKWFNLCPCSEPSVKCIYNTILSWLCDKVWLMLAKHTEISDSRHPAQHAHLQAAPSRTQTGMLLGDESPGVLKVQPFLTAANPALTFCETTYSQISKFSYFFHIPHPPNTKISPLVVLALSCWWWSRAAAPSKALNSALNPPAQSWVWQWCVPVVAEVGGCIPLARGCGSLVLGCFCLTPSATWVHLCRGSIITYKLANRKKIFQLIWNKSDILFFTSGEIFNYNNVALSFWQMLMNCCLHVWFTA